MTTVAERSAPVGGSGPGTGPENEAVLVVVGAGPRSASLLERLAASLDELLPRGRLAVHLVDPHPAGGGRIWRREQSPLLWMNSVVRDVTVFPDASVVCDGPVEGGPTLAEWVRGEGAGRLEAAGLGEHARLLESLGGAEGFASRALQGEYLGWALDHVEAGLPPRVRLVRHAERATGVGPPVDGRRRVSLASGLELDADVVVLAQGYLDREPTPLERERAAAAQRHGLTYVAPGYTADLDLSGLRAGEPVLVTGLGLAFVDLAVLLGQGRGGRFEDGADGSLTYRPSGAEPVLHVGSRRGVPYHAKLGYRLPDVVPGPPRHLTRDAVAALGDGVSPVDFDRDLCPLVDLELTDAHYTHLLQRHPERVSGDGDRLRAALLAHGPRSAAFRDVVAEVVPDPADRFDLDAVDRPLAGRRFADRTALEEAVAGYVEVDLERRADPARSADLAVFNALLTVYVVLSETVAAGRLTPADRVGRLETDYHGFFSFLASGPPPRRLRELLALHRAGVVRFLGPDVEVDLRDGVFVGRSPAAPGEVRARALVEARLPRPDVLSATDPVLRGLLSRGELAAEHVVDRDGRDLGGGQLLADPLSQAVRPDGSGDPGLVLLGPSVSGSAGSAGFARPGTNGPGFRQNDAVARRLLTRLAAAASGPRPARPSAHPTTPRSTDERTS